MVLALGVWLVASPWAVRIEGMGSAPQAAALPRALIWAALWALMLRWPVSASMMYVVAGLLLAALLGRVRERATVQGLAAIGLSAVVLSGSMLSTGPWTTSPSTPRVTEPAGPTLVDNAHDRHRSRRTPRRRPAQGVPPRRGGRRPGAAGATIAALGWTNSPLAGAYEALWGHELTPPGHSNGSAGSRAGCPRFDTARTEKRSLCMASAPLTRQRHGRADWMDCHPGLATWCELWHNHGEHPVFDAGMHHLQCRRRGQRDRPAKRSTGSFQPVKPLAVWTGRKVTGTADHQQATREGNVQIARLDPGNVDPHQECVPGLKQVQRRPRDRTGRPAGVGHGRLGHVANQDRQYLRLLIHAMSHLYRERVDPEHPHRARA